MENKQTAVEWLVKKTTESGHLWLTDKPYDMDELSLIIEQAKAIEKQQMFECWETAHQAGRFEGKGIAIENWQTFEQYYTETYTNENR